MSRRRAGVQTLVASLRRSRQESKDAFQRRREQTLVRLRREARRRRLTGGLRRRPGERVADFERRVRLRIRELRREYEEAERRGLRRSRRLQALPPPRPPPAPRGIDEKDRELKIIPNYISDSDDDGPLPDIPIFEEKKREVKTRGLPREEKKKEVKTRDDPFVPRRFRGLIRPGRARNALNAYARLQRATIGSGEDEVTVISTTHYPFTHRFTTDGNLDVNLGSIRNRLVDFYRNFNVSALQGQSMTLSFDLIAEKDGQVVRRRNMTGHYTLPSEVKNIQDFRNININTVDDIKNGIDAFIASRDRVIAILTELYPDIDNVEEILWRVVQLQVIFTENNLMASRVGSRSSRIGVDPNLFVEPPEVEDGDCIYSAVRKELNLKDTIEQMKTKIGELYAHVWLDEGVLYFV